MTAIDPDLFPVIVQFATLPGFRSATFHVSRSGDRVINYAQWDSAQTYQRSMQLDNAKGARVGEVIQRHHALRA